MASILNPLGTFSGRIGNLIYYSIDGKWYVRRRSSRKIVVRSASRRMWQGRFKTCISFYHSLDGVRVKPIWGVLGKLTRRSGMNIFIQNNIQAFSQEKRVENHELLHFSAGVLMMPINFGVKERDEQELAVSWSTEWEGALDSGGDKLCAGVIYDTEPFRPRLAECVKGTRADGRGVIRLQKGYAGHCHLYCYFASSDGKCYSGDRHFTL